MGSHKKWRKIAKRERRRRLRQQKATERCAKEEEEELARRCDENYNLWLIDQEKLESFKLVEATRIHEEENEKWLRRELLAQKKWRELQARIAKVKFEKAQQDLKIKKEWEEEQKKLKEAEEIKKKREEEELQCHEELMKRIEEFTCGTGELPRELCVVYESNPDKESCPFHSKIGICRFGDGCSRNHRKPCISKILLVKNFYSHFGLEQSGSNEYDTDILLEYDDKENYKHFKDFFNDVFPEFQKFGTIVQFKICCNFERHLRGNTYIEYETLREALKAYKTFHGRWYGGKQMSLQFCDIPSWKQAICGLFAKKQCPKGRACNFLHVFRNPGNMFGYYQHINGSSNRNHYSSKRSIRSERSWSRVSNDDRNWRWSESPERKNEKFDNEYYKKYKKAKRENERIREKKSNKSHRRDRSISKNRSQSHSKEKYSKHSKKKKKESK